MTVCPTDQPEFQQKTDICSVYQRISSCGKPRNMWVSFWRMETSKNRTFLKRMLPWGKHIKTLWGIFWHAQKKPLTVALYFICLECFRHILCPADPRWAKELSKLSSCGTLVCKELTFPLVCLVWLLHGSKHWKVKTPSNRINVKKILVLFQFPSEWCHHVFRKWTQNVLTNKQLCGPSGFKIVKPAVFAKLDFCSSSLYSDPPRLGVFVWVCAPWPEKWECYLFSSDRWLAPSSSRSRIPCPCCAQSNASNECGEV